VDAHHGGAGQPQAARERAARAGRGRVSVVRVVIAGGGTGGHLYPGIAVAEELRARGGHEVLFVGTARGIEARVVPREGWPLELIDVAGLKGGGLVGIARGLLRVPRALWQSLRILRRFRPDLVVGVGGYASGPLVLTAALTGRATAILEQNSIPGVTNRILGKVVRAVFAAFAESERFFPSRKVKLVGNPIRQRFLSGTGTSTETGAGAGAGAGTVLVCGGSQGAHAVNEVAVEAIALLAAEGRAPRVVHQTGEKDRSAVEERYRAAGVQAEVRAFIDDMAAAYRSAELVIGRAGATTLAELTAIGKPAILIPFPHAADDHQTVNARALETAGAARVFAQAGLGARALADAIAQLLADEPGRAKMAEASRALGRPDAARAIADALVALGGAA
jgi:UDP-N-acetylglucosamine--N-acetylmuramyl-(pentapeptide) pyrophosphoryl-undecaprenol N-acetylglucosamine transferase